MASSDDGSVLVAVNNGFNPGDFIYVSTDSGTTWAKRMNETETPRRWNAVASSADGTKLVAVDNGFGLGSGGFIYTSTDSGATWMQRASAQNWTSVASSSNGMRLVAAAEDASGPTGGENQGELWVSSDSGVTWTAQAGAPAARWTSVASSGDGKRLLAVPRDGQIHSSADFGVTWAAVESSREWTAVASSTDGSKRVAGVAGGQIYTDTSLALSGAQGTTATLQYLGNGQWAAVGQTQLAPNLSLGGTTSGTFVGDGSGLTNLPATTAPIHAATPQANMVWIKEGSFAMGSPSFEVARGANEGPQTSVTISRGFWMGIYEVTQAQYLEVMGNNPSAFTGNMSRPVERVSWYNAVAYCAVLTTSERAEGRCPATWSYRLPTEAEWEYACRAGTSTRFSYGDDPGYTLFTNYAWYMANSGSTTHPVGQKAPNPWGLYDMHGNVYEWCQDSWDATANYPGGSMIDPLVTTGSFRVLRGGNWDLNNNNARCASRYFSNPDPALSKIAGYRGFRAVLAPGQ